MVNLSNLFIGNIWDLAEYNYEIGLTRFYVFLFIGI